MHDLSTGEAWVQGLYMALKLLVATVLGAAIGFEREVHERPAGLRTHTLVCMGSTLITLISVSLAPGYDPGRIAAQIVSGIGFLGAGTILRQGSVVRGLTTAASLWTVSAVGMAVGFGGVFLPLAVFTTIMVLVTLTVVRRIEPGLGKRQYHTICLMIKNGSTAILGEAIQSLMELGVTVDSVARGHAEDSRCTFRLNVGLPSEVDQQDVFEALSGVDGLDSFEWA